MEEIFVEVRKTLGENVKETKKIVCRNLKNYAKDWNYQTALKMFCDNLKARGYNIVKVNGNYILASNNHETVTFYFTAHSPKNKNYCISTVLKYKVDYFAFYDNKTDVIYTVGYGIVRKYCKSLKKAYTFGNNYKRPMMFIPDEWAQQQKINTMLLY